MSLPGLVDLVAADPVIAAAIDDARTRRAPSLDLTAPEAVRPLLVAALAAHTGHTTLLVTSTYREAESLTAALASLIGAD